MRPPHLFTAASLFFFAFIVLSPITYMFAAPLWTEGTDAGHLFEELLDPRHVSLARNSLVAAGGTALLCLVLGAPLAILVRRSDLWIKRVLGLACLVPVLIPPYIHAIVWSRLNPFINRCSGIDLNSIWGVILVLSMSYFPFVFIMTAGGLQSIDKKMEEVALASRGKWPTLARITIPMISPHILSGAIFVFIFAAIDFSVPDILRTHVYPVEIFIQFSAFYDESTATLLSAPLVLTTLFLLVIQKGYMKDRSYFHMSGMNQHPNIFALGRFRLPAFVWCLMVLGASLGLPIGVLAEQAGPISTYINVFQSSWEQIGFSLVVAGAGALATLVLATSFSLVIDRATIKIKPLVEFLSFVPLAIPAITIGIGLIKVWNRPLLDAVYATPLILIIGCMTRFFSFSAIVVSCGLKQISPRLEEAGRLFDPSWFRVTRKIMIPLLAPSLSVGFFIVFILSFAELGATLLVIPPGSETIPIKIYNLMHYGAGERVAALSMWLVAIIFALSLVFLLLYKKLMRGLR